MAWYNSLRDLRGDVGNIAKNVSPFLALTPLGPLGSLAAGALGRAIQPGANLGSILKSGASNAAIGAGLQGGMGALRSAFNPSSSAAAASFGSGAPAATNAVPGYLGQAAVNGGDAAGGGGGLGLGSLADKVGGALKGVGSFAEAHPHAIEMGLGALDTSGRDLRSAQANSLNTNASLQQQQYEDYKRRMQALAPLLAAFSGQLQTSINNPYHVAKNPYA